MIRTLGTLLAIAVATTAPLERALAAAPVAVTKTTAMVSDPQLDAAPKAVPGSVLDYTVSVNNPSGGASNVTGIVYADTISARTMLYVLDLGIAGSGPVAFGDGSTLGLGGSKLSYTYTSLSNTSDSLEFSSNNGFTWTYVPVPDANGYDGQVTNIRIKPTGTQAVNSTFTMRYRVMVR